MSTTETTSLSPYQAAKVVNAALEAAEVDKRIPPQMMYNYTTARLRAGKAPFIECNAEGKIEPEALETWLAKYLVKQGVEVA
jgi:hypothetical protein